MWIMLIILTNCNDDCSMGNPSGNLKSVSGRYLEVFDVFSDGSLLADELDISVAHEFHSIGILLSFQVEVMDQQPASCDSTFAIIQDTVAQILITSDTDYDDNHAAGESLNDLFRMTTFNAIPQDFELIAQPLTIENYLLLDKPATRLCSFLLRGAPAASGDRSFRLEIELRSGKDFQIEMPRILVLP